MFGVTRVGMACVAAVVALGMPAAAGAANASTTSNPANGTSIAPLGSTAPPGSTTTTTAPALPPAFTLPSDFGYALVQQLTAAQAAEKKAEHDLKGAQKNVKTAKRHDADVRKQLRKLSAKERETERQLEATRTRLRQAAAEAYIHAGSGQLLAAISSFANANSAVDVGGQLHVIGTYGTNEKNVLDEYTHMKESVDEEVAQINDLADSSSQALKSANARVNDLKAAIANAKKQIADAKKGIEKFHAAATSALSPILGPSLLTAKQMADYVVANGGHPRITVPLEQLAADYLVEGNATGVRGDVAWAQSILETGSFANPGSAPDNNNFAGIGWCDSCKHGIDFPDARTGVRAQLQLLRIYVDPNFPEPDYKDPILLHGSLSLGFRGRVQTWWDLWGTWATGALYGQRVYDIYEKMVAFAKTDPDPGPPAKPGPIGDKPPEFPTTTTTSTTTTTLPAKKP
jgi:hypothetical protein